MELHRRAGTVLPGVLGVVVLPRELAAARVAVLPPDELRGCATLRGPAIWRRAHELTTSSPRLRLVGRPVAHVHVRRV